MTLENWHPSRSLERASRRHDRWRKELGEKKFPEMTQRARTSHVPEAFHLAAIYASDQRLYNPIDILKQLTGISYTNQKSSLYALLYAQSIAAINITESQKRSRESWPTSLYSVDFEHWDVATTSCEKLALEEKTNFSLLVNPSLLVMAYDTYLDIRNLITRDFDPEKIMHDVEERFSHPENTQRLESFVKLNYSKKGMALGW